MGSRTTSDPPDGFASLGTLIRSDPSVLEDGFRILDTDIDTGSGGRLDILGVDRSGRLAIVTLASGDPDRALARHLDGHLWVADRLHLVARLHAGQGVVADGPPRGLFLAPAFTPGFLRRLSLLAVEVVPYLAREVRSPDARPAAIVEPVASLFGIPAPSPSRPGAGGDRSERREPFWPEGVLPSTDVRRSQALPSEVPPSEEMPWPDAPEARFPWDWPERPAEEGAPGPDRSTLEGFAEDPAPVEEPAAAFETLTAEEMEEFERFERQRRERRGRST